MGITPQVEASPPSASRARRIASGVAGAATLVLSAYVSAGATLVAAVGVLAARALRRRRKLPLTRGISWVAAVLAAALALAMFFGVRLALTPAGTLAKIRANAVAEQRRQPKARPPEWLTRISPQATQQSDSATRALVSSPGFLVAIGVIGGLMACLVLGLLAGSVGWVGALLLGYAITGRWPVRGAAPDPT